ncbi:type VI secretion system protein TssA [Chromobacterium paludis]|uniref:Type VI secretion system protein TssA n=1 Tax=Chromobacterium paludis TaxID=2605945 RepID=A0A5C1DIS1_9NEIS|nr:type VI secretion system protein TssA [Chromobacterium paludis]QEL55947.1 type VI secretion system protein TssA [Chromobacterium paludis]
MSIELDAEAERRLADLLRPIADDAPCGEALRYATEYDELRELRRQDDPSLPAGVWERPLKQADWAGVEALAGRLLMERGKDLTVAAWLGEAWLHRRGLEGLRDALALLLRYCERYWDDVHPLPKDGDMSFRSGPLAWLIRVYAEVLETELPLLDAEPPREVTVPTLAVWREWSRLRLSEADGRAARHDCRQLEGWVKTLPPASREAAALTDARLLLQALDAWCDARMPADAPSFQPLRQALDHFMQTLQELGAMQPSLPAAAEAAPSTGERDVSAQPASDRQAEPANREEAYRQLRLIAGYLARTEPHSPVPYLIQRAVEWGDKPLRELLAELLASDAEARRLWSLLGVLP